MKYFTGIDVSLRFVSICVVDEAGEVRHESQVADCGPQERKVGRHTFDATTGEHSESRHCRLYL